VRSPFPWRLSRKSGCRPAGLREFVDGTALCCDREQPFLMPPDVRDWLPEVEFPRFGGHRDLPKGELHFWHCPPHHSDPGGDAMCAEGAAWDLLAVSSALRDRHFYCAFASNLGLDARAPPSTGDDGGAATNE
jgi:hypothetical protein